VAEIVKSWKSHTCFSADDLNELEIAKHPINKFIVQSTCELCAINPEVNLLNIITSHSMTLLAAKNETSI